MTIIRDFSPNLDSAEVQAFVLPHSNPKPSLDLPNARRPGYTLSAAMKRPVGTRTKDDDGYPLTFLYSEIRHVLVVEGKPPKGPTVLANFDVVVPCQQKYSLTVYCQLLLQVGLDPANQLLIENAFSRYDANSDGDIDHFVKTTIAANPALNEQMFVIAPTGTLQLVDQAIPDTRQFDAVMGIYTGTVDGTVTPGPGQTPVHLNDPPYMHSREIEGRVTGATYQWGLVQPPKDANQIDVPPTATVDEAVDKVIDEAGTSVECNSFVTDSEKDRVAQLTEYPEFRVEYRDKEIVLADDCGIRIVIVITVPVLQYKRSGVYLYAFWRLPKQDASPYRHIVEGCLWKSALSVAVIGVAFGNFVVAVAAFRALFVECVQDHLQMVLKCFIPGLVLATEEKQGWTDLIAP